MSREIQWGMRPFYFVGVMVFFILMIVMNGSGRIIVVDDDGGKDYSTIQVAIDAAEDGDEVRVWEGIYEESIIIDTSISLVGNGSDQTCVSKGLKDYGIKIIADNVLITGFLINSSGGTFRDDAGIWLQGVSNCNITQNQATTNYRGIFVNGSSDNVIHFNDFSDNSYIGIQLRASGSNSIFNNTCNSNNHHGIHLEKDSDKNRIVTNVCNENGKNGVLLDHSSHNEILKNDLQHNGEYGILVDWGTANSWDENRLYGNGKGGASAIQFNEEKSSGISGFEGGLVIISFFGIAAYSKKQRR